MKIVVYKDGKPTQQITMEQNRVVIGRRSECDIPIKDPAVSGNHAEIEFVGNGYILRDLNSTNGVHVKGRQIKEYALKNEDLVTIGEHQLKIFIDSNAAPSSITPAKPAVRELNRDVTEVRAVPVTTSADGYLKYVKGGQPGQIVKLDESLTTIGVPGIQVAAVSKRPHGHFMIHVDGGKDRNKTPIVNGEAIGFKSRKLEVGDLIEVADISWEYCID
ncbi:MAG: FHA domain-containing protein [Proteobacteria bacterium]|nr:FHA domain-containing protein [Pseudomonadota bacterium]